ncbi:MAG: type II toxin-antitoxin system PemK/MazF family toxin, partial [SAR324 cluster bacterium]|nr:type II toxin-antitoxin system PemK/MazF family toxin [SAR324 cluster bacterium]
SGLPRDSVLNISQVITVDKKFIKQKVKRLSNKTLQQVEEGLRLILEL